MITVFKNHGVPEWIKVDNGRPFGDPQLELIPALALWLIGLGINVLWNRPAKPQDNAIVERSQGVMGRWTEYQKCSSASHLQMRLWKEAEFHNLYFPIRRKSGLTRRELFPRLYHSGKQWNPANFDLQRVLNFLAPAVWERKASKNGQFWIYGQRLNAGVKYKHQKLSIKLDPKTNQWRIFNLAGELIMSKPSPFSSKSIWRLDFSAISKNL